MFKKSYPAPSGADLGGGCRRCALPSPWDNVRLSNTTTAEFCQKKKEKRLSQLRHSFVLHPFLRKILDPPLALVDSLKDETFDKQIKYWYLIRGEKVLVLSRFFNFCMWTLMASLSFIKIFWLGPFKFRNINKTQIVFTNICLKCINFYKLNVLYVTT